MEYRTKPSFYDHPIFLDSKIYVYNEVLGQVVEHSESVRFEKVLTQIRDNFGGQVRGYDVKTWFHDDGRRNRGLHANEQVNLLLIFFIMILHCKKIVY